jgi:Xaa-Pro aminopeptidase
MRELIAEKLTQAGKMVYESELDCWLIFVRETAEAGDPILPYLIEGSLTWQSALILGKTGERIAVVGTYDGPALESSGHWDRVVCYDRDIRDALLSALNAVVRSEEPRVGVNFSVNDEKCDGLTHGMFLLLTSLLHGTRYQGALVSAEQVCMALRSQKTQGEVQRMKAAIAQGDSIFQEIGRFAKLGTSELQIFESSRTNRGEGPGVCVGSGSRSNSQHGSELCGRT